MYLMISWISQTTFLKRPGPADLLYTILGRLGPFFWNMLHNSFFKLLFCPDLTIAMLSWQSSSQFLQTSTINAAARLIFNEPKRTCITTLFINLHWLPIAARIKFKALVFAYKPLPKFITSDLYALEACVLQVNDALLYHPKETQNHFHRLFHELFPPGGITCPTQSDQSLAIFKKRLKTHLFHLYLIL